MTREAVHAAATLGKRFESLLKRACKNFKKLLEVGAVYDHNVRMEPPPDYPEEERPEYLDAVEEYEKIVESFEKLVKSKAMEDFSAWSWGEKFVKWAGKERISVGYTGRLRERSAEYFLMDIALEGDLPYEKTVEDLYKIYKLEYLENLKIPSQAMAEIELLEFLDYTKKWPRSWTEWVLRNVYPLEDGFWITARKILALESLRDAWEDIIEKVEGYIEDELRKTPQYEVLKRIVGDFEAERYVRKLIEEVKAEIVEKYANTVEDVDKVKNEFFARVREVYSERMAPESKILEVYEEIKPLIPPEKVALTRGGLIEAIRWAFIHPQLTVDGFASVKIFPLMFTTEQAKQIAAKILEKVTGKPPTPPPPPPKPTEIRPIPGTVAEEELLKEGWFPSGLGCAATPEEALKAAEEKYGVEEYEYIVVWTFRCPKETPYTAYLRKIPPKIELVKVKMLEAMPIIVGPDGKTYGPFKKGEVYEIPKETAEEYVKKGMAIYEYEAEAYEREQRSVRESIERLGKYERLAYFLNERLKWRYISFSDQIELLKKIVEGWTNKDYQTFYDMYPEKVKEVPSTFTLLGLPLPPPPEVPETVPALREQLEEEKAKRREAELLLEEEKKKAEVLAPAVEVAPPPIKEPVPEEEQVVYRDCYEIFRKLWDEIKKTAAMEVGIPTVSRRTGIGAEFIRKALATAYTKQLEKIERLANELTECQCEIELKEKGAGFLGEVKKCQNSAENQKKST